MEAEPITIVSGLPRSGTSLAMQMLVAGGMDALTDQVRVADTDNPRGYFEYEPVKALARDASWTPAARGRAIKIISHLLAYLPAKQDCRILFLERDLDEVLASQAKMIARLGAASPPEAAVRRAFEGHLASFDQLASRRENWDVLRIRYADLVADAKESAGRLADFLDQGRVTPLDRAAMAAVVDPALYRSRSAQA